MKKNNLFITFLFIFLFFLIIRVEFSQARSIYFPIHRGEKLLRIYHFNDTTYVLSQHYYHFVLRSFNNGQIINSKRIILEGETKDFKFLENGDSLLILFLIKENNSHYFKFFNSNLELITEINLNLDYRNEFIYLNYLEDQNKLISIFKEGNTLKLNFLDLLTYTQKRINLFSYSKLKLSHLSSNNFYTLISFFDEIDNKFKIYIFDRDDNLIYENFLSNNFHLSSVEKIGNFFYFCGKNENNYFKLITLNLNDFSLSEEENRNIKIADYLSCYYLEGDINNILLIYRDGDLKVRFLNEEIIINLNYPSHFFIKDIKIGADEIFSGYLKIILENRFRIILETINIFNTNQQITQNFSNFEYIDNYFDQVADKILILFQGGNRSKIYSEF
ncbi:MAG: hypothetical protein NZ866_00610 [Patescibacteria group bacterium]|nr:hypothetical protein [Patescibacteria group bacterium]